MLNEFPCLLSTHLLLNRFHHPCQRSQTVLVCNLLSLDLKVHRVHFGKKTLCYHLGLRGTSSTCRFELCNNQTNENFYETLGFNQLQHGRS